MTRQILVGGVPIGGGAPVVIQSMLNTKTTDVNGSLEQIARLKAAGCQIARLAIPTMEAAKTFSEICRESPLPGQPLQIPRPNPPGEPGRPRPAIVLQGPAFRRS